MNKLLPYNTNKTVHTVQEAQMKHNFDLIELLESQNFDHH